MVNEAPSPRPNRRRKILSASGFAHFIHDGFTDSVYVLLPLWATGFNLNHAQVGFLKACLSVGLSTLQLPAGFLAERFGERIVLVLGTVLAGLGFILVATADGFWALAVCLFIAGAGCSTQHPLASALVSTAYAGGRRRAALGTYNFTGDLGKVAVPASVAAIAAAFSWREGALIYGLVGIAAAVAIYLVLRRLEAGAPEKRDRRLEKRETSPTGWGIRDWRGFSALGAISIIDCSARFGFLTFLPFLLIAKGAETTDIGFALALLFGGGAAGKLICGLIAERVGILRTVILTELATAGLIVTAIVVPLLPAFILLPVIGVALNGTSSVLYGTVGDFVDADRQARAFGLFYTLGTGAGAASPFIYGLLSDFTGLNTAFAILAGTVLLVLPLCLVLRPSLAAAAAQAAE